MAAVKQLAEERKVEALEDLDFAYREKETKLVKIHDNLYIPQDFSRDHNYYADPEGKKRYYGITTVLSVIAKPALIPWAAGMACDYIREHVSYAIPGPDGGFWAIKPSVVDEAKVAHAKRKETAGEQGTDVHAEIETYINYCVAENEGYAIPVRASIKEEIEPQTAEFVNWAVTNKVKFLGAEVRLCSPKLFVAGTADFVAEIDGKLMVGDVKTSNSGIYPENYLQGAAYAHMAREMGLWKPFKGVVIVNIPKRGGITVKENYDLKGCFEAFKYALGLFKFKESQKTPKKSKK